MKLKRVIQIWGIVVFSTAAGIASYHQITVHKQLERSVLIIYDQPARDKPVREKSEEAVNEAAALYQETEPDIEEKDYMASLEMLAICVEAEAGNQISEKELRRLMNANFRDGDLLVRLDFSRESYPTGSKEMQDRISKALRKLRTKCKKIGIDAVLFSREIH